MPRTRRSTRNEGAEKAWFYVAIWTVVPAQVAAWGAWRLVSQFGIAGVDLARWRLATFLIVTGTFFALGVIGSSPRTARYYATKEPPAAVSV